MIGYHAVPVIADADAKGIGGFDRMQALMAMRKSAEAKERYGLGAYMKHAMLSLDDEHESVSRRWSMHMMIGALPPWRNGLVRGRWRSSISNDRNPGRTC